MPAAPAALRKIASLFFHPFCHPDNTILFVLLFHFKTHRPYVPVSIPFSSGSILGEFSSAFRRPTFFLLLLFQISAIFVTCSRPGIAVTLARQYTRTDEIRDNFLRYYVSRNFAWKDPTSPVTCLTRKQGRFEVRTTVQCPLQC